MKNAFSSWFSLFASTSTLICCALPSLLVALGMGATMASLVTAVPQLVWISEYKEIVFAVSGLLMLASSILRYKSRNDPCPIDPDLAKACMQQRAWSKWVLIFSWVIWLTGATFAFVLPLL